jgi:serine protein kinase
MESMSERTSYSGHEVLEYIDQFIKKEFDTNRRLLSFDEYMTLLADHPERQMRGTARYITDMMDFFGKTPAKIVNPEQQYSDGIFRYHVFDEPTDGAARRVVGLELAQTQIYRTLKTFSRVGINNKLILLHGPNGSAKSSMIHALMMGLERYSQKQEGANYTFNWVFPVERYTKGGIGLGSNYAPARESLKSYARLPDEEVLARISCDLKDHPLLLIPAQQRKSLLEKLFGQTRAEEIWNALPHYFTRGDLCHRCKQIFEALLNANGGDFKKVLMHVQVDRFYHAFRYRKGLVTIEPQMHVDAQYQQLTMNRSMGNLPASLQSLNLFSLSGDLVDANRGIVEYSDLLKRPVDTFKYLLVACETGAINIGPSIAHLDTVMLGSSNELQLDAFKEFPDFTSFKARIELIRVPYLLSFSQEQQIYAPDLALVAAEKHVAPHTAWTLALWAVLTRLKKPNSINYPPNLSMIVSNLTPLEKAKLYDTGEMSTAISPEDRKMLRASLKKLREEYQGIPYYEGRMGASAREVKSILFGAAQNTEFTCLSPLAVLREMEEFVKRVSEYDFLKQDVKDGFHDAIEFINVTKNEYLSKIDREVRDCIGLYNFHQWEEFLRKYIQHISLILKKEKIKNPITGKLEDPDHALIQEFEKIVEAPQSTQECDSFRQNIISQVGAWSLDHPNEPVVYAKVFPEFWRLLEKHYYESQKALLTKMHNALLVYDSKDAKTTEEEGSRLAQQTVDNMREKLGYCDHCAKEVITFLMRQRY